MNDFLNTDNVSIRISAIVAIRWKFLIGNKTCVNLVLQNDNIYFYYDDLNDFQAIKQIAIIAGKDLKDVLGLVNIHS
ncbi:hypothetical protein A6769_37260 [Nostoc punctiforme NIES-2108]|uniref:Uncharacterized protein n=1 Tax=Nostoc punctiforme NIES-2108 TaxID=1356359 RepID=A0A367S3J4_NOSPU|nr:hypothetical protein A6769_37260 [Nostoc punctiforme NIES-2108]